MKLRFASALSARERPPNRQISLLIPFARPQRRDTAQTIPASVSYPGRCFMRRILVFHSKIVLPMANEGSDDSPDQQMSSVVQRSRKFCLLNRGRPLAGGFLLKRHLSKRDHNILLSMGYIRRRPQNPLQSLIRPLDEEATS